MTGLPASQELRCDPRPRGGNPTASSRGLASSGSRNRDRRAGVSWAGLVPLAHGLHILGFLREIDGLTRDVRRGIRLDLARERLEIRLRYVLDLRVVRAGAARQDPAERSDDHHPEQEGMELVSHG